MGAGAYDAEADVLFNRTNVHGYFMEYDSERAGGFEAAAARSQGQDRGAWPGHQQEPANWNPRMPSSAASTRRRSRPARSVGAVAAVWFRLNEEAIRSRDEQWAKLRMIVEVADEVWGR